MHCRATFSANLPGVRMRQWLSYCANYIAEAISRRWFKVAISGWAVVGAYDLLLAQFLPESLSKDFPRIYTVLAMTAGWLPWWFWGWIGTALLAVAIVEKARRDGTMKATSSLSRATQASPAVEALARKQGEKLVELWESLANATSTLRRRSMGRWDYLQQVDEHYFMYRSSALAAVEFFEPGSRIFRLGHDAVNRHDVWLATKRSEDGFQEAEAEAIKAADALRKEILSFSPLA